MSFSSPIYVDYNDIFLIFIQLWVLERNRSEFFHSEKSVIFRTLQLLCNTLRKSCHRINARCECNAGLSGDLRSRITRYYSKKPSGRVRTRCDKENQAFLTMDCDRLQSSFTSPHSLSVNGNSSSIALGETICR